METKTQYKTQRETEPKVVILAATASETLVHLAINVTGTTDIVEAINLIRQDVPEPAPERKITQGNPLAEEALTFPYDDRDVSGNDWAEDAAFAVLYHLVYDATVETNGLRALDVNKRHDIVQRLAFLIRSCKPFRTAGES